MSDKAEGKNHTSLPLFKTSKVLDCLLNIRLFRNFTFFINYQAVIFYLSKAFYNGINSLSAVYSKLVLI